MTVNDKDEVISLEKSSNWNPWKWDQFNIGPLKTFPIRHTVYLDEKILGYLCTSVVFPETEIQNLCVHPDMRRKHIASSLMQEFVEWCEEQKIHKIFLEVREKNFPARNLYRKFHFELMDIRKDYYANPADNAHTYSLKLN